MKICVVQTKPIKGNIQSNIDNHKKIIQLAISYKPNIIIFPELSITGYEPSLSGELATSKEDSRFDDLQKISDNNDVVIGVGVPTKNNYGISISMILFQPNKEREIYSKKYLHPDEEEFFISGKNFPIFKVKETNIALAICYELSISEHSKNAFENGAEIYIASVAKSASGVEKAYKSLSNIANKYSLTVLMSNCVGYNDNFESAGQSSVWNNKGLLVDKLDNINEGIIIFDTDTQEVIKTNKI